MTKRKSYIVLGLMSGTSLDGVDAAFLETDGEKILQIGPSLMRSYAAEDRDILAEAIGAAVKWQFFGPQPNILSHADDVIIRNHETIIRDICEAHPEWAEGLNFIGFHGQTVLHQAPQNGRVGKTLQIGDGQALANRVGLPVCYDFRAQDVKMGGQGAPLAPIFHQALCQFSDMNLPQALLNIGGVSNVTLIGQEGLFATDCGPGNGPLDSWVGAHTQKTYDENGIYAMRGIPDFARISRWMERDFFGLGYPKSADRYDFDVRDDMAGLSLEDGAATLAAFTALSVKKVLNDVAFYPATMIICGGGRYNRAMCLMLSQELGIDVHPADSVGWDGDAIEAQAFAYLAVRTYLKRPLSFPMTTGVREPQIGGKIAYPSTRDVRGVRGGQY